MIKRLQIKRLSHKKWLVSVACYVLFIILLLVLTATVPGWLQYHKLVYFFFYVSVAFTFLPLPVVWIILLMTKSFDPLFIAFLGTCATCLATFNDYYILNHFHDYTPLKRLRNTAFYGRLLRWFSTFPFITLVIGNFFPLPLEALRLLSVSAGYSRYRYVVATFLGRFPRYCIVAFVGYTFNFSISVIILLMMITLTIGLVQGLIKLCGGVRKDEAP